MSATRPIVSTIYHEDGTVTSREVAPAGHTLVMTHDPARPLSLTKLRSTTEGTPS